MTNYDNTSNFAQQGSIERCPHDKINPYSMINNALIRDASLSPDCRWLLTYLLSNRDGWKIKISQIVTHLKPHMGKTKVYALFNQAIDAGYLKREEIQRLNPKGGTLKFYNYIVSETPKFKKFYRFPENRDTGDRDTGETNSKNNNIDKNDQDKEISADSGASSSQATPFIPLPRKKIKQEYKEAAPGIFLTSLQEENVFQKCGRNHETLQKAYIKLSDWKIGKGINGGRNDYKSLTDWVLKAVQEENLKSSQNISTKNQEISIEEIETRRSRVNAFVKKNWDSLQRLEIHIMDKVNHLTIGNDKLYYNDPKFDELFVHFLRKNKWQSN